MYILLSAKRRAYFCKSIAIEMGGVLRYFSEVSGSGVDVTILSVCITQTFNSRQGGLLSLDGVLPNLLQEDLFSTPNLLLRSFARQLSYKRHQPDASAQRKTLKN